jgi:group I intron endonuclease
MDRKKELKQLFKETPVEAGVYRIQNTKNRKIFVGSATNLKRLNGIVFTLETGTHLNKELQQEWNQFGKEAFSIEVLEVLKKKTDGFFDVKKELEKLEAKWLDQLQPYGERGYNRQNGQKN